ncbi:MAG: hypothetical protein RLZZ387_3425 [Chloroflexota bacterium]|jgi:hypothetical protein
MFADRPSAAPSRPQAPRAHPDRPYLIFFADTPEGLLLELLQRPGVLGALSAGGFGVAVALDQLSEARAIEARLLNDAGVPTIGWLVLPAEEGQTFSLQNYPRAEAAYRDFRAWALAHALRFEGVGLDIEPPLGELERGGWRTLRSLASRLWLARDNALYPSARAAYVALVAAIQADGYEVHAYQLPLVADDRRAGTTIVQRGLDIVDLPVDLEVLVCSSGVPIDWLGFDLGGALVDSYGPAADALAVGAGPYAGSAPLAWWALRRDLLLAARHVDTIYIATLEACVCSGTLEALVGLEWDAPTRVAPMRRVLVGVLRTALLLALVIGRYGRAALAWSGWLLALAIWLRSRRRPSGRTERDKPF